MTWRRLFSSFWSKCQRHHYKTKFQAHGYGLRPRFCWDFRSERGARTRPTARNSNGKKSYQMSGDKVAATSGASSGSVDVVKGINGLDKVVLRDPRGSSAEVCSGNWVIEKWIGREMIAFGFRILFWLDLFVTPMWNWSDPDWECSFSFDCNRGSAIS